MCIFLWWGVNEVLREVEGGGGHVGLLDGSRPREGPGAGVGGEHGVHGISSARRRTESRADRMEEALEAAAVFF